MTDYTGKLLNTEAAAALIGEKPQTWRLRRQRGDGPKYIRIWRRAYYDRRDIDAWLESRKHANTAEESARLGEGA